MEGLFANFEHFLSTFYKKIELATYVVTNNTKLILEILIVSVYNT